VLLAKSAFATWGTTNRRSREPDNEPGNSARSDLIAGLSVRSCSVTTGRPTRGEGTQNLLCAYLAAAVLVGLLGNALFGLWWLDPAAALVVAAVALKEGRASWLGEGCCATC
jgi:hypothetical protein